jgi:hypothetical protein
MSIFLLSPSRFGRRCVRSVLHTHSIEISCSKPLPPPRTPSLVHSKKRPRMAAFLCRSGNLIAVFQTLFVGSDYLDRQALEFVPHGINHTIVDFSPYKAIATVFIVRMAATPAGTFMFRLQWGKSRSDVYTYVSEHFSDATELIDCICDISAVRAGVLGHISENIRSLSELEELFLWANNSSLSRSC